MATANLCLKETRLADVAGGYIFFVAKCRSIFDVIGLSEQLLNLIVPFMLCGQAFTNTNVQFSANLRH